MVASSARDVVDVVGAGVIAVVVHRPGKLSPPVLLVGSWRAQPVTDELRARSLTEVGADSVLLMDVMNGARSSIMSHDGVAFGVLETFDELANAVDARQLEPEPAEQAR